MTQLIADLGEALTFFNHPFEIFHLGSEFLLVHEADDSSKSPIFESAFTAEKFSVPPLRDI